MEPLEIVATAALKTLVLTDLVESTRLVGQLGDKQAAMVFGRHDRAARDLLVENHGREIDKTDGFLLMFDRPLDALRYALAYHAALRDLSGALGVTLSARVGIHLGEVYLRENPPEDVARGAKPLEMEGLAKPVAARLMALAVAGQTLLTRTAFDVLRRASIGSAALPGRVSWVAHGNYTLKGVDEPVEIYEAGETEFAPLAPPPDSEKAHRVVGDQTILGWRPSPGHDVPHRGNWVLREKLGEGGYGEVWLAVHKKTHDRLVFKFCFEAERLRGIKREVTLFRLIKEALGNRDDIARIRDWNFDEPPYFLEAEYTEGGSLVEWFDKQGGAAQVPLRTRLDIVAGIAEALAAAHSVGVLHKDLKPANVLIDVGKDGRLQPKLTDFGIGLLTDAGRLAEYGITVSGATEMAPTKGSSTSGTVQYMAPELVEGKLPTTQADIYSLGVILYQVSVGDLQRSLAPGWDRQIEPDLLREDIAAAVEGSLERRLASAGELAQRLRTLEERQARREAEERARKALERARRRRKILIPAMVALAAFSILMIVQARRIAMEAERANREAEAARQISDYMVEIFTLAETDRGRADTITAREILDRGAARIRRELAGQPLTQARLMNTIALAYLRMGLLDQAEPLVREALDIRRKFLDAKHLDIASSLDALGQLRARQKKYAEAETLYRQALAIEDRDNPNSPGAMAALLHLAELFKAQGRHAEAQPFEERAARIAHATEAAANNAAPARGAGAKEQVALLREVDVPQEVEKLLGTGPFPGTVRLSGAGNILLADLDGKEAPRRVALAPGEALVAGWGNALVLVRSGNRLVERAAFVQIPDFKGRELFNDLKPAERVFTGPDSELIVRLDEAKMKIYREGERGFALAASFPVGNDIERVEVSGLRVAWCERGNLVRVFDLAQKREILNTRCGEGKITALELENQRDLLAVGGWFDEVFIFNLKSGGAIKKFSAPGQTYDLLFLPDYPTLVVGRQGGLLVWREQEGLIARFEAQASCYDDLAWTADGLLARDRGTKKISCFAYRTFPLSDAKEIAGTEVWAMAPSPDGRQVFAGTSDGRLHRYDLKSGQLESVKAHTQGLTSIVFCGNELVSASDDKTIARWSPDTLKELSRSKAHRFLVNGLYWEAAARRLWSASSDHFLKAWSYPDFRELEALDPGCNALQAAWVDSRRGEALIGTWNACWVNFRLKNGRWAPAQKQAVSSECVYSIAENPLCGLVMLIGIRPAEIWVFDRESGSSWRLPNPDPTATVCCPHGGDRFLVFGRNTVLAYTFHRQAGTVAYSLSVHLNTDLGILLAGAAAPAMNTVIVGNNRGRLLVFDPAGLSGSPLARGTLTANKP